MEHDIYRSLRQKVNEYGTGFPVSPSGVELKLLKIFFAEEDAELYIKMAPIPETVEIIAGRIGEDTDKTAKHLERMLEKGTVLCFETEGRTVYAPAPYIVGLYENTAKNLDATVAELLEQYHKEVYFKHHSDVMKSIYRYLPVQEAVTATRQVLPHDDVIEILKSKNKIAVIDCICRKQLELAGTPTDKPLEVCFSFDAMAEYYVDKRKQGRYLNLEEAVKIQNECEKAGLVTQTTILQESKILCHCDKHCIVFRADMPVDGFKCNYYSQVDADTCIGCGQCMGQCLPEALILGEDGVASVQRSRCIGCGLCVTVCPNASIALRQKPEDEQLKELLNKEQVRRMSREARSKRQ